MDLLILNKKYQNVDVPDSYESLIWTDRYYEEGDFEIYTSATKRNIDMFKEDYFIWSNSSDHVMIIDSIVIENDAQLGNHLTISGHSLESILKRRIIWKQTILDGKLEDGIEQLLNENIIEPSDQNRTIDNFIFIKSDNPYIDSISINTQFTGDNLYDAIRSICVPYNIGFKIVLNPENKLVFQLYSGTDRSYDQIINPHVVFSPNFDNIINSKRTKDNRYYKNVALVAGEGEGLQRKTLTVGDETLSGIERRELYVDAREIQSTDSNGNKLSNDKYYSLLKEKGENQLSEDKPIQTFDGSLETTKMYKYETDFFMGDIVQIEDEFGYVNKARVIEYIRSENQSGTEAYPTFDIIE